MGVQWPLIFGLVFDNAIHKLSSVPTQYPGTGPFSGLKTDDKIVKAILKWTGSQWRMRGVNRIVCVSRGKTEQRQLTKLIHAWLKNLNFTSELQVTDWLTVAPLFVSVRVGCVHSDRWAGDTITAALRGPKRRRCLGSGGHGVCIGLSGEPASLQMEKVRRN